MDSYLAVQPEPQKRLTAIPDAPPNGDTPTSPQKANEIATLRLASAAFGCDGRDIQFGNRLRRAFRKSTAACSSDTECILPYFARKKVHFGPETGRI